jgi:hypothetical protein
LLKQMAGINITHVPYRGVAAGALSDVITGRVDAMFNTTGSLLQASRSGQVRALAVTSARRFQMAQEFPTIAESGVPGLDATSWYAIFVPGFGARQHRGEMIGAGDQALKPSQLLRLPETFRIKGLAIGEDGVGLAHSVQRLRAFQLGHAGEFHLRELGRQPRCIGLRIGANDQDTGRGICWNLARHSA